MAMTGVSILVRLGISRGWHVRLLTRGKFYAATLLHCMFVYLHLRYQLRRASMWITNYYIACLNERYLIHVFYLRFPSYRQGGKVATKTKDLTWAPMYKARKRFREKSNEFYRLPGYNVFQQPRSSYPLDRTLPVSLVGEEMADFSAHNVAYALGSAAEGRFKTHDKFRKLYKFGQQTVTAPATFLKLHYNSARRAFGCGSLTSTMTTPVMTMRPLARHTWGAGAGEFYKQPNAPKTTVVKVRRPKSVAEQMVEQQKLTQQRIEELAMQGKTLFMGFVSLNKKPKRSKVKGGKKANKKAAKGKGQQAGKVEPEIEHRVDKAATHSEISVNRTYDAGSVAIFNPAYQAAWAHSSKLVKILVNRMMLAHRPIHHKEVNRSRVVYQQPKLLNIIKSRLATSRQYRAIRFSSNKSVFNSQKYKAPAPKIVVAPVLAFKKKPRKRIRSRRANRNPK